MKNEIQTFKLVKTEFGYLDFCTKCDDIKNHISKFGNGVSWSECETCGRCTEWTFDYDGDCNYDD